MSKSNLPLSAPCPCGTGKLYEHCCYPFHINTKKAGTPLALMRSRYSAFCTSNTDYLVRTQTEKINKTFNAHSIKKWSREVCWDHLEIIDAPQVPMGTKLATVHFKAHYIERGKHKIIEENSLFIFHNLQWLYTNN